MSPKPNPLTRGKKQKVRALLQHNQLAKAKPLLEQICHADRRDAESWYLLAAVNQQLGVLEEAAEAYRQVAMLEPRHAEAHYYLGNTYLALGNGTDAAKEFHEATQLRSDYLAAHINLGALLEVQKKFVAAETSFRTALGLDPGNADLHYNLGNTLQSQEKYSESIEAYKQALALRSNHADTYNNLGNALAHLERYDEANSCYRDALRLNPRLTATYNNLGNTCALQRRFQDATDYYRQALAIDPHYAEAQTNLGNILRYQGRIVESIMSHRQALTSDPNYADTHFNLAFALLLTGQFREGWPEYAWHWQREGSGQRPFVPAPWDGTDLKGQSVFLHAEQGLGDELFFLRFVPELKQRGAGTITYRPTPKIASLLARSTVINRIAGPDEAPASGEIVFSVGDLPRLLGMERVEQIPPPLPLTPMPAVLSAMRERLAALGPPPYIGLTWRAGTSSKELVLYKAGPLESLAESLKKLPATWIVLQRNPATDEIRHLSRILGRPAHNLSALNEDLEQMLALLSLMDEYVGVSNTNMHLRAGVGKTARVLVPSPPEWRWMAEGKESPWFPGFSVYRQGYDGSWGEALESLSQSLVGMPR